ncbi:hypothetical protein [Nocardia sp. NPDC050710]|uniref:hypothetical protein n=1 Tax=Nocardia sp. NPDC050710 TaxID=3157220 RepID=UPI003400D2F9
MTGGFSVQGNAVSDYFQLTGPQQVSAAMPAWEPHFTQFDTVIGYSALGHAFLADSRTRNYAVLHPYSAGAKSYGFFPERTDFITDVLLDPGFGTYVLRTDHVDTIRQLHGPLDEGHVYIATPYPFLGGNEDPGTYTKGDVWVFLDLVADAHGL